MWHYTYDACSSADTVGRSREHAPSTFYSDTEHWGREATRELWEEVMSSAGWPGAEHGDHMMLWEKMAKIWITLISI